MCCYVSSMFIRECSCFLTVAQVVSLAYRYSVTCSIVTTSFVIAVNITTLKPFKTVMGWWQPVQKQAWVAKPYVALKSKVWDSLGRAWASPTLAWPHLWASLGVVMLNVKQHKVLLLKWFVLFGSWLKHTSTLKHTTRCVPLTRRWLSFQLSIINIKTLLHCYYGSVNMIHC